MINDRYKPLPQVAVCTGGCYVGGALNPAFVQADSPAIEVMTDLTKIPPATVSPQETLQAANQHMLLRGVRLLLVVERNGRISGVVTARDLMGEKPILVAQARGSKREELEVRDVMTSLEVMEAIKLNDVMRAEVGHIVATLKACGRQHTLVVEEDREANKQTLRGIFSASQIARQLGVELTTHEVARTFAEIEAAFAGV
jgi:signal-transduction protein with cAMP-binding, CBS, and nucleotidyltransferase domain